VARYRVNNLTLAKDIAKSTPTKIYMKTKLVTFILIVAGIIAFTVNAQAQNATQQSDGFNKMKSLAGKWEGTLIRANGDKAHIKVEFKLISGDTSIQEDWNEDGVQMLTIYHDRAGTLGVVHYCALGNAPAFTLASMTGDQIEFKFDPMCGLDQSSSQFVTSMMYRLNLNNNEFYTEYDVNGKGDFKNGTARAKLKKVTDWTKSS
jgi:hypothetical protein